MRVLTVSLLFALAFGIVTLGSLPNDPAAVTDEFVAAADDDHDAAGFDDPQAARAKQASRGIAMSARKRRMKTSRVVDVSSASLLARPSGRVPHSAVPQPTQCWPWGTTSASPGGRPVPARERPVLAPVQHSPLPPHSHTPPITSSPPSSP